MNKLVLIDGHAILHRAYHALPKTLTTRNGEPINAVYGFVSMLLRVISDLEPTHMAVCFDRKEPTFRKEEFEDYQAHRPEMDEELESQIPVVKEVVRSFRIPIYEKAGFEADDVIGTLAQRATKSKRVIEQEGKRTNKKKPAITESTKKFTEETEKESDKRSSVKGHQSSIDNVIVVTGDKDILQLVNDRVHVYLPKRGLSDAKEMEEKDVVKKLKVEPEQIVDYKALVGDPSDNYPGVKGIGPKTAETLLAEFGSLDEVYKFVDQVADGKLATTGNTPVDTSPKGQAEESTEDTEKKDTRMLKKPDVLKKKGITENVIKKLKEGKEDAYMSQKLAMIVTDVEIDTDFEDMNDWEVGSKETLELFKEIGFKTLTKRVKEMGNKMAEERQGSLF